MPKFKIKGGVYSDTEDIGLGMSSPMLIDGYVDTRENTVKRPGAYAWVDLGTNAPVTALKNLQIASSIFAVSGGKLFRINYDQSVFEVPSTYSLGMYFRPSLVTDGDTLWVAVGTDGFFYYKLAEEVGLVPIFDVNAPAYPTSLEYLLGNIITNRLDDKYFQWAGPTSPDRFTWDALDIAEPATDPDTLVRLGLVGSDLLAFGPKSTEIWTYDGVSPFSFMTTIDKGIAAPYSFVKVGTAGFWVSETREVIAFSNRQAGEVSFPIRRILAEMPTVLDAYGMCIQVHGYTFAVWNFPSALQTWAYCIQTRQWQQWGNWISAGQEYFPYIATSSELVNIELSYGGEAVPAQTIIGTANGKILIVDSSYEKDDNMVIRLARRSGVIDYGTFRRKRSDRLTLKVSNPNNLTPHFDSVAQFNLRWRDDGGQWGMWRTIPIDGRDGDMFTATLYRLGVYSSRQYEIMHDESSGFVFVEAEEEVTVL